MFAAFFYTRAARQGQSRFFGRIALLAALAASLSGCAGLGLPFDEAGAGSQASLSQQPRAIPAAAVVVNQADPSDWEMIRRTAEGAPATSARLGWTNPVTGSAGSISIASDHAESLCRAFAVTISDMRGVSRYHGDACMSANGHTRLGGVVADDATLL